MSAYRIESDNGWFEKAPEPVEDQLLSQRLEKALLHPWLVDSTNENHKQHLSALKSCGIILNDTRTHPANKLSADYSSATHEGSFACYLVDNLLNVGLYTQEPCKHQFNIVLPNDTSIHIPARSHLLLKHLSEQLNTDIFLFASRGKPVCFIQESAVATVALYYHVDSYLGIGEYKALKADPFAMDVDDFIPNSPVEQQPGCPAATFRAEERSQTRKRRAQELDEADCELAFEQAR